MDLFRVHFNNILAKSRGRADQRTLFFKAGIFLLIAAITISTAFVFAPGVSAADGSSYIKVGLAYGSNSPASADISADCELGLYSASSDVLGDLGNQYGNLGVTRITLSVSNGQVLVSDQYGDELTTLSGNGSECIMASDYYSEGGNIYYGLRAYRGGIIPYIASDGSLSILNYLSLDDYVRGVLHAEIGQSSPAEALKAQALAARSYAIASASNHKSQGFALCCGTHCQSYNGASGEYPSVNAAVDATAGETIHYKGQIVQAFYHANSGGHTQNSENVWSSVLGYVRGKVDPYSPAYTWTTTITRAQLTSIFAGKGVGTVTGVSIDSLDDAGYAYSVTVEGTASSYTVTKESIRSMFGSSYTLKSRQFTLSTDGGSSSGNAGTQPADNIPDVYARGSATTGPLSQSIYVISSDGSSSRSLEGLNILGAGGSKAVISGVTGSKPSESGSAMSVTLDDDTDTLIINGNGYGHGIGMSQQGAQAMARQGFTYKDILEFYYTDIEIY